MPARREEIPRGGVHPRPVRPEGVLGGRLRASYRPLRRRADTQLKAADIRRRPRRRAARADQPLLHQRRGVPAQGPRRPAPLRQGRREASGVARRLHGDAARPVCGLLPQLGTGDERRRPRGGREIFPRREAQPHRDGAAHTRHLLERPLPPHHLHHRTSGDQRRRLIPARGARVRTG